MLEPLVKKLRDWNYRAGLERRSKAGKFNVQTPPQWRVAMPCDSAEFNSRELATQFAAQHPGTQPTLDNYSPGCIEPATMRWIIEQRAKGVDTGSLSGRIMYAHPESFDDLLAWFEREPDPAAAFQLLRFAFSLGRTDATHAVAAWASEKTNQNNGFFSPMALDGPLEDPYGTHQDSARRVCLFGRLIHSPVVMQWFFDNQPELKSFIQDPVEWARLERGLHTTTAKHIVPWPAAAYYAFGHHENPLQEHWPDRPMQEPDFMRDTIRSYAHSPAAQSYLVHYHLSHHADQKPYPYMVADASPEVMELYHRMRAKVDNQYTPYMDLSKPYDNEKVEGLMLGLHLGMDSTEFYYHAKTVFALTPDPQPQAQYADLDTSIF